MASGRRRPDGVALTAGLLSLAVSVLVLVARAGWLEVDGLVVVATLWVVLGLAGVIGVVHRVLSPQAPSGTSSDAGS